MKLVEQFAASGLSQRDFAEQRSVSVNTLQFWIYKLRRESKAPRFVPVHVVASAAPKARRQDDHGVVVTTRSGHLLRFADGTDPKYIAAVVAELG
ncbi:MAG TPA: hypothetical protein VFJ86_15790 [Usitatibacter sp.]|nr:hypothetical protein [Usitatibacter sp.]